MPMLYEEIATGISFLGKPPIPQCISDNLKHDFRPYQINAMENFIFYMTNKKYQTVMPKHLLFHMATGSGKTNIIASAILYLYCQGYRNFIFFVNTENIIIKTKDNLLNKYTEKYLFKENITIDNKQVNINQITSTFDEAKTDDINIYFTTVQGLHITLTTLRENGITYQDFEDKKIVLLADEAHHLNANLNTDEENTWGSTVQKLLNMNAANILLEFTATIDFTNQNISTHYQNKIIFDYPLKKFREDKFSKDIILQSDSFANCSDLEDKEQRMLQAILISQYRKIVAENHKIALKPVVMFKNKTINDADDNYLIFTKMLAKLNVSHLKCIFSRDSKPEIIEKLFQIYNGNFKDLVVSLQRDFTTSNCAVIYGGKKDKLEILSNLNSLESPTNNIRVIFSVNILNEGWDVLNLFDVVKLDEPPNGAAALRTTTTQEAQLIGRGARYYPFSINDDEKYKRKYDEDLTNELRVLEEMYFHSVNNNQYIGALKDNLTKSGIADFNPQSQPKIVMMNVKDSFTSTQTYQSGAIYVNKRIENNKSNKNSIKDYWSNFNNAPFNWTHISSSSHQTAMESNQVEETVATNISNYELKNIDDCVVRSAINRVDFFYFSNLKKYFPHLKSISEFIGDTKFLKDIKWQVTHSGVFAPSWQEQRNMVIDVLLKIKAEILKNSYDYEGSKDFCPIPIKSRIINRQLKVDSSRVGMAQLQPPFPLNLTPDTKRWYVYDENFGTSEEQAFVKFFDSQMQKLSTFYKDIWLIRNEKSYWVYGFNNNGQRFEPDFILLLTCKSSNCHYQVFIEPKGNQLLLLDQWKDEFLIQISQATICSSEPSLIENDCFKIMGLPFYNESNQNEFQESFYKQLLLCDQSNE